MTLTIATEPPPLRVEADGTVRVGGTRVTLDTVIRAYNSGAAAEQIVRQYDTLTLADVHSMIGYYLRHRAEIDSYLGERQRHADVVRREIEADPATQRLRERLRERRAIAELAGKDKAFDFLSDPREDIYSESDGEAV